MTPVLEQGGSPRPGCPKGGSWPCGGKGFVPMARWGAWSPFGCPQAHIAAQDSRVWCWALSKMPQTPRQHPSSRVPQGQRCPQPRKSPSSSAARSLLHQAPGAPWGRSQPSAGAEHLGPELGWLWGRERPDMTHPQPYSVPLPSPSAPRRELPGFPRGTATSLPRTSCPAVR